jgi:hypothetical protein
MALFKHFTIKENIGFEFRGEAFNIFNHTQWSPLDGLNGTGNGGMDCTDSLTAGGSCLTSSTFLHASGAHNPRILQLGLKFPVRRHCATGRAESRAPFRAGEALRGRVHQRGHRIVRL